VLRLHYSNRPDALVAAVIARCRADGSADPFADVEIAVSGRAAAAKLRFALADRLGVVAGYRFPILEGALRSRLESTRVTVADRARSAQALLAAFREPTLLARPELAPVLRYLDPTADRRAGLESRQFQLADELAGLFADYDRSRPDIVRAWASGKSGMGVDERREGWQRALWQSIRERGLTPLCTGLCAVDPDALPGGKLTVLASSFLPRGVAEAVAHLARSAEVEVYALSPTREYWEDIASTAEERRAARRGAEVSTRAPLALRLWGRPSRDTSRFLSEVAAYDFGESYVDPTDSSETTLARWQRDILELAEQPADAPTDDDSIRVHDCPSLQRELEVVATDIWTQLRRDGQLRCSDIAIYVAGDVALYQAELSGVFHALGNLPHHFESVPLGADSRLVEAFEHLVELPLGNFTRPEMMKLLLHPAIIDRFPEAQPEAWAALAERLGIVHGADHEAHAGTYIERDLYNWDQGARRVALGAVMSERLDDAAVDLDGGEYRPLALTSEQAVQAAQFALMSRSMIADCRFVRHQHWTLTRWARWFESLAHSYLVAASNADERALARIIAATGELADLDDGTRLPYELASATLRRGLAALTASGGELCADGVMIAPLEPGKIVAAHTIYVVGLDDDALPPSGRKSPLDLRQSTSPGDIEPGERIRLAFLEALLAARSAVRLSFVGRDGKSGDARAPAALVTETLSCLRRGYCDPEALMVRHPLRAWDDVGERSPALAIRRRWAVSRARAELGQRLAARGRSTTDRDALRAALDLPECSELRRALLFAHGSDDGSLAEVDEIEIPLTTLRRFLESPVQAWAAQVVGIASEDELGDLDRSDEPLSTSHLDTLQILRDVFIDGLRRNVDGSGLRDLLRRRVHAEELASTFPTGMFARHIESDLAAMLEAWRGALPATCPRPHVVSFGRARERADIDQRLPPLVLELERGPRIALVGLGQPWIEGPGSLLLTPSSKLGAKHRVRGFFEHLVRSAAGLETGAGYMVFGRRLLAPRALHTVDQRTALAHLGALCTELLTRPHDYALPCELALHPKRDERSDLRLLHRGLTAQKSGTSDAYGPLRRTSRLEVPDDAAEMIERRFALLYRMEGAGV